MADVMADNQTDPILSLLDRGEADDGTRDRVSAALLRAVAKIQDQQVEMKGMIAELRQVQNGWCSQVKALVASEHDRKCADCPAKRWWISQHEKPPPKSWLAALLSSETFRYFLLVVALVYAIIYATTGRGGVTAAGDGVSTMIRGVSK